MSEYVPTTRSVMHGYVSTMNRKRDMKPMEAKAAFNRWFAEVERKAAEKAWDEGYDRGFYAREALPGDSRDASEGAGDNPYEREDTE